MGYPITPLSEMVVKLSPCPSQQARGFGHVAIASSEGGGAHFIFEHLHGQSALECLLNEGILAKWHGH